MKSRATQQYMALYIYMDLLRYRPIVKDAYIFRGFFTTVSNVTYSFACVCKDNHTTCWYDIVSPPPTSEVSHTLLNQLLRTQPDVRIIITLGALYDIQKISTT